ncbi:MAG: hypothetical protein R6V72_23290 [Cyclobacterium sp.]|uniref:hypothetical protein n=1 Tax=unclassified Cyclobacterium TaxID=2615055 RepID=UPI0013CFA510|nr:hypothetical protein [Cyclobacterium sp. SYSU L10401]
MKSFKKVHLTMTDDAGFHADIINKLIENLQAENRIEGYEQRTSAENIDKMRDGDVYLIVVTEEISSQLPVIQNKLKYLKHKNPGLQALAILVDGPKGEQGDFVFFPEDRIPLRERADWEQAWKKIEHSLKELFPKKNGNHSSSSTVKPAQIIIPLLVLIVAGIIFYLTQNGDKDFNEGVNALFWDEANWDESQWQ